MTLRVVLVDDQSMVRTGFRMILDHEDDIAVVGEAADGEQAIATVLDLRPEVVLMDIQMPRMDGIEATRQIVADGATPSKVLILTTFERDEYIYPALRAGASGFLLKNSSPESLVNAVRIVATGDALLGPSVTRRVIEDFVRHHPSPSPLADRALERLTDREREVLVHLATGRSNAELAEELDVGEGTVKTHVSRVLSKLGLRDRVQAVVFAYESGLVHPG